MDQQLRSTADVLIAGTGALADSQPGCHFIPCGVHYDIFARPRECPTDLLRWPRPYLGYFGTISERVDMDLVLQLAEAFPNATVVMIGPVHMSTTPVQRPNIWYAGFRDHEQLPAYAQQFSVGLIPFRLTSATLKLHPVKTMEYLAAGVPVVSTAIPDVARYYSDVVQVATSPQHFVQLVGQIISGQSESERTRGLERARAASWEHMTECINQAIFGTANPVKKH